MTTSEATSVVTRYVVCPVGRALREVVKKDEETRAVEWEGTPIQRWLKSRKIMVRGYPKRTDQKTTYRTR